MRPMINVNNFLFMLKLFFNIKRRWFKVPSVLDWIFSPTLKRDWYWMNVYFGARPIDIPLTFTKKKYSTPFRIVYSDGILFQTYSLHCKQCEWVCCAAAENILNIPSVFPRVCIPFQSLYPLSTGLRASQANAILFYSRLSYASFLLNDNEWIIASQQQRKKIKKLNWKTVFVQNT